MHTMHACPAATPVLTRYSNALYVQIQCRVEHRYFTQHCKQTSFTWHFMIRQQSVSYSPQCGRQKVWLPFDFAADEVQTSTAGRFGQLSHQYHSTIRLASFFFSFFSLSSKYKQSIHISQHKASERSRLCVV